MDSLRTSIYKLLTIYHFDDIQHVLDECRLGFLLSERAFTSQVLSKLPISTLHKFCKEKKLKRYAKLKKSDLVLFLTTGNHPFDTATDDENSISKLTKLTTPELRALCKQRGFMGISKMKKENLIQLLNDTSHQNESDSDMFATNSDVSDTDGMN